jgi:arylsulfate sulfotransferase
MFLSNVLRRMLPRAVHSRGGSRPAHSRRHRARPLVVEALEDRCLLSSYSFALLADDGPNSPFILQADLPQGPSPLNDHGTAEFHSALRSGGEGVFTRDTEGNLGIIAVTSDLARAFPLAGGLLESGTVSFGADLRDGTQAVFTGSGGALSRIADTGPDSPFSNFLPASATINNDDTVAFRATLKSGGTGIFTGRAGETPHILYVTGGRFAALLSQNIQRNGSEVAFRATLTTGGDGVFLGDGLTTTTIATTGDTYSAFGGGVANDAGTVAFVANLTAGGQAVVTGDGTHITTVADTSGPYSSFIGTAALNNAGQVVFTANLAAGGSGIFSARGGVVDEIMGTGDSFLGSTVSSFATTPFAPRGLNNPGQLSFGAHLADGRTVLVRADPLPFTVSLEPNATSSHLVGDPVTWTATATNGGETPVYQFSVGAAGGPLHVVRDFSPSNSFTWAPMQEGSYNVQVTVKASFDATRTHSAVASYLVDSRVTGSEAVISPTSNPLVALYSVPPGPAGTVHVEFSVAGAHPSWRSTDERPSVPGQSTNFLVAGMLANTTYQMRYVRNDGTTSSLLLFTTRSLPSNLVFPSFTVQQPPGPGSDLAQDMLFHQFGMSPNNVPNPLATDLSGRVVWYYDVSQSGFTRTYPGQSLVPGGTVLVLGVDRYAPLPATLDDLREIDLAGNVVRETNLDAVNAQLTALGHNPIFSFTHDVQRLPNGQTVVIGSTERTIDINGTRTDYVGMTIVVLDQEFQVSWAWDAFDHLDVNRGPILGELYRPGDTDQVASSTPRLPAVAWVHINAVSWSPADGNLVLSSRNQDWVIKIDYRNGEGDGHVIWRLGQDGDFTVDATDPNPWFSHQHNAHYIDDSTLILFDNGNTRRASDPSAHNRGQVWMLDQQTMTATLALNADLDVYSDAFGGAQRLSNGNYSFTSGRQGEPPNIFGQSIEVGQDGTKAFVLQVDKALYRSFRISNLYEGTSDQLAAGGGRARSAGSSLSGSVPSSVSDPARVNPDPVKGLRASPAMPGTHLADIGVWVAPASVAPLKQLATPTMLSLFIPDLANRTLALDSISVPLLDGMEVTGDSRSNTLTGGVGRGLFLGKHDLELTDWDALPETFVEL